MGARVADVPAGGVGTWVFEVYEDRGGDWRWCLRGVGGPRVAMSSQSFDTHSAAWRAAEAVRRCAGAADIEDRED